MRKKPLRRISSSQLTSKTPRKRGLRLSLETVRTLTSKDLSLAVSGCPITTDPTTQANSVGCGI